MSEGGAFAEAMKDMTAPGRHHPGNAVEKIHPVQAAGLFQTVNRNQPFAAFGSDSAKALWSPT